MIACSDSCRYHGVKAMVVTERCRLTGLIMGFIDQPSSAMGQPRQLGGGPLNFGAWCRVQFRPLVWTFLSSVN